MHFVRSRRLAAGAAAVVVAVGGASAVVGPKLFEHAREGKMAMLQERLGVPGEKETYSQGGVANGGPAGEAFESLNAAQQFDEARTAPSGIVDPGAYSAAYGQLNALAPYGGSWQEVTQTKYDADDPAFRDYYSNSSGGSGYVTGRITGLAADDSGDVYAAGADGGVWRSTAGGGNWTPIADTLPSLSSGDLELGPRGALWYATGEGNTGGTSYVGAGVFRLASPKTSSFQLSDRVGGDELESTTINSIRFSGNRAWAATLRGVWYMNLNADGSPADPHWTLAYAPNPQYLPSTLGQYAAAGSQMAAATFGATTSSTSQAPYKNIANDVAVDPKDPKHVIAAIGWRSGDSYNGFYESKDAGVTWAKINPQGGIDATDIGYVKFAYAADGSKLYAINQSPRLLNKATGTVNSYLDGIYVSNSGDPAGPWTKIADSPKLANAGSALKQTVMGKGYGPGIQSWYNQFIAVDPTNPDHVVAGLEEVYDTRNAGASWNTIGPYWNFTLGSGCWNVDAVYPPEYQANRCPLTTHPDQHSVAIGKVGGVPTLFVGNDGGVYSRPLESNALDANGNATDWTSLNDGTIDALQYYAVGVGRTPASGYTADGKAVDFSGALGGGGDVIVSGGLQDNGGSLIRYGASKMSSNFGGDGGDVLVDPANGCNIVQEYVYLSMRVTRDCAQNNGPAFTDPSKATTYDIAPPETGGARFIAPFAANKQNVGEWLAGGNSLWIQEKGFQISSSGDWTKAFTFSADPATGAHRVATAVAINGSTAIAASCGPCNNSGFARTVAVGTKTDGKWSFTELSSSALTAAGVPRRYVGGVAVGDDGALYLAVNGFSRRFTEGEGAGIGHVYRSTDGGQTWTSIDGSGSTQFPDVPANSIQVLPHGIVVGTDLGVVYKPNGGSDWYRLGTGLPVTVAMDVEQGPDGYVYAGTHGRGIWRIQTP